MTAQNFNALAECAKAIANRMTEDDRELTLREWRIREVAGQVADMERRIQEDSDTLARLERDYRRDMATWAVIGLCVGLAIGFLAGWGL